MRYVGKHRSGEDCANKGCCYSFGHTAPHLTLTQRFLHLERQAGWPMFASAAAAKAHAEHRRKWERLVAQYVAQTVKIKVS